MQFSALDQQHMQSALELAKQGQGHVEPNPMVGCVIAAGQHVLGRGFHARFGGDHAEVAALCSVAADQDLTPATMYVTLEPCCHKGKTPPCTNAIVSSGIRRVVVAARDPFAAVDGRGIEVLQQAGVTVEVGLLGDSAQDLIAPFTKRVRDRLPWMIAKWAMSLDGRIATYRGDSQWISNDKSRAIAHQLRGRMDAILIGVGTALADDPRLTARPPGPRVATRVVVDSSCASGTGLSTMSNGTGSPNACSRRPGRRSATAYRIRSLRVRDMAGPGRKPEPKVAGVAVRT